MVKSFTMSKKKQLTKQQLLDKLQLEYPVVAHYGHNVSHAKNRTSRAFKYNLHTVTVIIDGEKKKFRVPTKVLRRLKKAGVTTHWKKPQDNN